MLPPFSRGLFVLFANNWNVSIFNIYLEEINCYDAPNCSDYYFVWSECIYYRRIFGRWCRAFPSFSVVMYVLRMAAGHPSVYIHSPLARLVYNKMMEDRCEPDHSEVKLWMNLVYSIAYRQCLDNMTCLIRFWFQWVVYLNKLRLQL